MMVVIAICKWHKLDCHITKIPFVLNHLFKKVGVRVKNFVSSTSSRPPILWVRGALSPVVKQLGHEADHSSPAAAEVKKIRIYTSTPPYTFMA
jgi:hypothetical protein